VQYHWSSSDHQWKGSSHDTCDHHARHIEGQKLSIALNVVQKVEKELHDSKLSKLKLKEFEDELARVGLFKALFQEDLDGMKDKSPDEISRIFQVIFSTWCVRT
jgi:hypothetical protein